RVSSAWGIKIFKSRSAGWRADDWFDIYFSSGYFFLVGLFFVFKLIFKTRAFAFRRKIQLGRFFGF
ncbi:MAG: hypothetical protein AAB871_00085, partial [Patescibacteria group bacterium]